MTFSPNGIRETPFIANLVDYSIPYNIERVVSLTHVTNKMNSNISYFSAFDSNVWVLIIVSMIIMTTILQY